MISYMSATLGIIIEAADYAEDSRAVLRMDIGFLIADSSHVFCSYQGDIRQECCLAFQENNLCTSGGFLRIVNMVL